MRTLQYEETKAFYKELDQAARAGERILIQAKTFPNKGSKLLERLARCQEFKEGMGSPLVVGVLDPGTIAIILTIWLTLVGLFLYAVYKGYRVKFKKGAAPWSFEFELEPMK